MVRPLHVSGRYILDDFGRRVRLRGSAKYGFENYPAGGSWGDLYLQEWETPWFPGGSWNTPEGRAAVENWLDVARSWGINVIRFPQSIDQWKFNLGNHRQIIKELLMMMAERDMYMIYSFFKISSEPRPGGTEAKLPYPPYMDGGTHIIANEQEFADVWGSMATELKDYPNIIFDLYNEPRSGIWKEFITGPAFESWGPATQMCIDSIRAAGAEQPIVVQWWTGVWTNLAKPADTYSNVRNLDWLPLMNPQDPLNNIIISTHMYRYHFFAHWQPVGATRAERTVAWERDDILTAFERFGFEEVASRYPLLIGEIGCNMDASLDDPTQGYDTDLSHELAAFENCLSIFNERGYHFCTWWFSKTGRHREHDGYPNYTPNEGGQILINALAVTPIFPLELLIRAALSAATSVALILLSL